MATSKSAKKATAEVVDEPKVTDADPAPGTKDEGAGTEAGEQIGSTPAEGVEVPDIEGGVVPEATPDNLSDQAPSDDDPNTPFFDGRNEKGQFAQQGEGDPIGQPDPDVNQPDAAVMSMRMNPKLARSRGL